MPYIGRNSLVLRAAVGAMLVLLFAGSKPAFGVEPAEQLTVRNAFHIVGAPGVKRNSRVDLDLTSEGLRLMQGAKISVTVPYARMTRLEVLDGTRTYAKAAYASVVAFGLPGLLLLTKKNHVDTLVLDYVNERGGQIGMIIQVPAGQGEACREWVRRRGVSVHVPEPLPEPATAGDVR